jgi:hypothetical protein
MDPGAQIRSLLSGVRRLTLKEAKILSEEHKAVLLVVLGYAQRGGVSKTGVGEILGLIKNLFASGHVIISLSRLWADWIE